MRPLSFIPIAWPGVHEKWAAESAVVTPYGAFDVEISGPKGEAPREPAIERAHALAAFARKNVELIADIAYAHFRWAVRTWGEAPFRLMAIPVQEYTRSNILRQAGSRKLCVVCEPEGGSLLWSGISLGIRYDEEHGLGLDFDGTVIASIDGSAFRLVDGELEFVSEA